MLDTIDDLFSSGFFMPHGQCYLWKPGLVWLQVVSNGLIGLAYLSISATLSYLVYRARNLPFRGIYLAFGVFIVTCGVTHFFDVWVIWHPTYWLDGVVRAITAVASVATAILLPPLIPKAVALTRGAQVARERGVPLEGMVADFERVEAIREAREEAEQASRVKSRFLGLVSHELRTPLTALKLQVDVLRRTSTAGLDERQRGVVERMSNSVLRLSGLIESLLQYSRIQSGRVSPQIAPIDVGALVRGVVDELRPAAERFGLEMSVELAGELPPLMSDQEVLQLIVGNLGQNALKYTEEGRVTVSVSCGEGQHRIEVRDTGPGIPEEERRRIFEPFERLGVEQHSQVPGIGLGLALVREMVAALRGRLELVSEVGVGSAFTVELPSVWPSD